MRKIITVTLFFLSCRSNTNDKQYFELSVVKRIAELSSIDPPPAITNFIPIYIIGSNDSILESSFVKLRNVYKTYYVNKYRSYSDFLFGAINQNIKIETKDPKAYFYYSQVFLIDPNIAQLYKEKGIKGLIAKFCFKSNDLFILNREQLTLNNINSISYYFFINQYLRVDDDSKAVINFEKLSQILN